MKRVINDTKIDDNVSFDFFEFEISTFKVISVHSNSTKSKIHSVVLVDEKSSKSTDFFFFKTLFLPEVLEKITMTITLLIIMLFV